MAEVLVKAMLAATAARPSRIYALDMEEDIPRLWTNMSPVNSELSGPSWS